MPDFTLAALDGSTVTLSNLYGQVIVIDFWTTWCGPCVESLPHLQNVHERYADRGVTVLAINIEESSGEISQFVGGRYTFPILLDQDGKVSDAYRVWAIPYTLVIDQTGSSQEIPMGPMGVESVVVELLNP
ncbi:MAG: TlpA family protein disulfide reductase [Anaerolineae bacterium]|nr:TlpA family protein disulfide reductase [Anaerolineae bacterium]